jgi:two-component system response regulator RegX3
MDVALTKFISRQAVSVDDRMPSAEAVLIVDNEETRWKAWSEALEKHGYIAEHADTIENALSHFEDQDFGLVLVNLKLNGRMNGMDLLDWIQENNPGTDVIVIATYATLDSSIGALHKGAYDYLVKPVNIMEVVTRVDRCMSERRESAQRLQLINQVEMILSQLKKQILPEGDGKLNHDHILETPSIIVDRRKRLVIKNGEPIQLSPTEFDILDYLVSNSDRVVSASELIRAVQGYDMDEMDARPIVRVNIRRLRQKIEEDTSNPKHIITVRSKGYRFAG